MIRLTKSIRDKGYPLSEFLSKIDRSLRWYRMHNKPGAPKYDVVCRMVDELEDKR